MKRLTKKRDDDMTGGTWMTTRKIAEARSILRECTDVSIREEGLACLRNAKPEYLCNLIHADHPDRIAALEFIEKNSQ